jgi:hypothetical protein
MQYLIEAKLAKHYTEEGVILQEFKVYSFITSFRFIFLGGSTAFCIDNCFVLRVLVFLSFIGDLLLSHKDFPGRGKPLMPCLRDRHPISGTIPGIRDVMACMPCILYELTIDPTT